MKVEEHLLSGDEHLLSCHNTKFYFRLHPAGKSGIVTEMGLSKEHKREF